MKVFLRYLMAVLYFLAGVNHFIRPQLYLRIMPPWIPFHEAMVYASGVAEMVLGLLLIPPATRRLAAWGIMLLLVGVFPANIQMAINYYREDHAQLWIALLRLPMQILLIWWAYQYTQKEK